MDDPRRRGSRRVARTLVGSLAAVLALGAAVGSVAADDAVTDPLAGPFADVALVSPSGSAAPWDVAPRVIAIKAGEPSVQGAVDVVLLGVVDGRWSQVDEVRVATGLVGPGPARLVELDGWFAVVATDDRASGPSQPTSITLLDPAELPSTRGSAVLPTVGEVALGPADVDGDGTDELIVTSDAALAEPGACPGMSLTVLDARSLAVRDSRIVEGVGIDGAAVGRFRPSGGEGLIAYVRGPCQSASLGPDRGAVVIDLASGAFYPVGGDPLERPGTDRASLVPILADLDQDGVDEPIMREGGSTVVLDPAHDWQVETIVADSSPLAVIDSRDHPRLAIARTNDDGQTQIDLMAIGRIRPGAQIGSRGLASIAIDRSTISGSDAVLVPPASASTWIGDPRGNGCLALLVPAATLSRCPTDGERWTTEQGPPWLKTIPLAAYGHAQTRRLLVAAGTEWSSADDGLAPPWPDVSAAVQTGGWRSRPSRPFALQVVDVDGLTGTGRGGSLSVGIVQTAISGPLPEVGLAVLPGDRVFVRGVPTGPVDPATPGTDPAIDPLVFLLTPPSDGLGHVGLAASATTGTPTRATALSVPLSFGALAWFVDVVALDGFGRPSSVSHARVELDTTGPTVAVEPPFLSVLWPFSTRIAGSVEPGARVRLGAGPFTDVGPDGSFAFEPALAPWPQDLEIEAVDSAGNPSWRTISVVGGIDYRRLPLQTMLIVVVLLGATATTWGVPSVLRRRRSGAVPGPERSGRESASDRRPIPDRTSPAWRDRPPSEVAEYGEIEDLPPRDRGTRF